MLSKIFSIYSRGCVRVVFGCGGKLTSVIEQCIHCCGAQSLRLWFNRRAVSTRAVLYCDWLKLLIYDCLLLTTKKPNKVCMVWRAKETKKKKKRKNVGISHSFTLFYLFFFFRSLSSPFWFSLWHTPKSVAKKKFFSQKWKKPNKNFVGHHLTCVCALRIDFIFDFFIWDCMNITWMLWCDTQMNWGGVCVRENEKKKIKRGRTREATFLYFFFFACTTMTRHRGHFSLARDRIPRARWRKKWNKSTGLKHWHRGCLFFIITNSTAFANYFGWLTEVNITL